jgi:hypothetical protein
MPGPRQKHFTNELQIRDLHLPQVSGAAVREFLGEGAARGI